MKNNGRTVRLTALHFCFLFVLFFVAIYIKAESEFRNGDTAIPVIGETIQEGITEELNEEELSFILFHDGDTYPARKMEQNLSRFAEQEGKDVGFYKVNGPENESLCIDYEISGFPSVVILKKGEECNRILGVASYSTLKHIYNKNR